VETETGRARSSLSSVIGPFSIKKIKKKRQPKMFASNKTTTTDEGKFTVRVDIFYYFPLQCDDIFALLEENQMLWF
jgi:hypothetical protein